MKKDIKIILVILIIFILIGCCERLFSQEIDTPDRGLSLMADTMRFRAYSNDRKVWSAWDTSQCSVPIDIMPDFDLMETRNEKFNQLTTHNALDQTFSIKLSENGRYYTSEDYEGCKVAIAIYKRFDDTYNVLFHYDKVRLYYNGMIIVSYEYQYLHAKPTKP